MKLLLVSYYWPPHGGGGVLRALETLRLLAGRGWEIAVVSGPEDGWWVRDHTLAGRVPFESIAEYLALADVALEPKSGDSGEASGKLLRLRELCEPLAERQDKALVFTAFDDLELAIAAMTGKVDRNTASATARSLNAQRSSIDPPPRVRMIASMPIAGPCLESASIAWAISGAAASPCT